LFQNEGRSKTATLRGESEKERGKNLGQNGKVKPVA